MVIYIEPELYISESIDTAISGLDVGFVRMLRDKHDTFQDLFKYKGHTVVVSEPGYGKTRLLKEIVFQANKYQKEAIYLDLKIIDDGINDYISKHSNKAKIADHQNKEKLISGKGIIKSENFDLTNCKDIIICLDALDEVKSDQQTKIYNTIFEFLSDYPDATIFISCRQHYLKSHKKEFTGKNLRYIVIDKFHVTKVRKFLLNNGLYEEQIEKIIDSFQTSREDFIIQIPRYLEILTELLLDEKVQLDKFTKLNRCHLFEIFIYKDLEKGEEILGTKKQEITKRVLEKLALIMEIYQTTEISKDELMTFFDDMDSGLVANFLQQVDIEFFYDKSLLKDNYDKLEFHNVEFQEYLAAKEIIRLGSSHQRVFDFIIDQEMNDINPSWYNNLSYIVELEPSLFEIILNFIEKNTKFGIRVDDFHSFIAKVNPDFLSDSQKNHIFSTVFLYYQMEHLYINIDIAEALTGFYNVSLEKLIRESISPKVTSLEHLTIQKANASRIIQFLIQKDLLDRKQGRYWKKKLLEFLKDGDIQLAVPSIYALSKYKSIKLMKTMKSIVDDNKNVTKSDERILGAFINSCAEIDPNDDYSIETFVEGMIKENLYAGYALAQITASPALLKLIEAFDGDDRFLEHFVHMEYVHHDTYDFIIDNLEKVWNKKIEQSLTDLIVNRFSGDKPFLFSKSAFILKLCLLLKKKNGNYVFDLLDAIRKKGRLEKSFYYLHNVLSHTLEKSQVKGFVEYFEDIDNGAKLAFSILNTIYSPENKETQETYEEGRKYLKTAYEESEKSGIEVKQKEHERRKKIYDRFLYMLEPRKKEFMLDVFDFYLSHKDIIDPFIQDDNKDRLEHLVKLIFKKLDPAKQDLYIVKEEGLERQYKVHQWIPIFGRCIVVASLLDFDSSKYRTRILSYIPFAFDSELSSILSLVKNPTDKEINDLLKLYDKKRNDDLLRFRPASFIDACSKYKIIEATPILKRFVEDKSIDIFVRESALKSILKLIPEAAYFNDLFARFKESKDENEIILRDRANNILIEYFRDEQSILWKFDHLEQWGFTRKKDEDNRPILDTYSVPNTLMLVTDPKYIERFIELLGKSFDMYDKGEEYRENANYIWQVIIRYFDNLKVLKNYKHIKVLEEIINDFKSRNGVNRFLYLYKTLKQSYMISLSKPENFLECIKKYNRIKQNTYQRISSPEDLLDMVKDVLDTDIKSWIHSEGANKLLEDLREELIQKTLKTELEKAFLRRGLRSNEVDIIREAEMLDGIKPDFLISYGFVQGIMIEIKLLHNTDLTNESNRNKYKKKLLRYIDGTRSKYGLFLIFRVKDAVSPDLGEIIEKLGILYKDCGNVTIAGFDCLATL